mmetsp:Transcript_18821/g.58559  ORF Transcript_18821/g.58559 Transcript_18821/m.58559 type:complete len:299 (-) Transcript_18821:730-1626(-)
MPTLARSTASRKSWSCTRSRPSRAASSAPSFTTLASSAPANPAVTAATATMTRSFAAVSSAADSAAPAGLPASAPPWPSIAVLTSSPPPPPAAKSAGATGTLRRCTARMARRPSSSGTPTVTRRAMRPGRQSAGSRISWRLVLKSTTTSLEPSKPSISASIWLSVWSRSSLLAIPRRAPTASTSSMKTTLGDFAFASRNRSRTRAAPRPTKSSTNSDALALKNGTPASPATARASSVLPVPGGPTSSTPLGSLAPSARYLPGLRRKLTTSISSSLASGTPATSLKVTRGAPLSSRGED